MLKIEKQINIYGNNNTKSKINLLQEKYSLETSYIEIQNILFSLINVFKTIGTDADSSKTVTSNIYKITNYLKKTL